MTPYYSRDGIVIYNADCRDVLPTLGTFDLLLTDPPYEMTFSGTTPTAFDALRDHEWKSNHGWIAMASEQLNDGAAWYCFTNDDDVSDLRREAVRCGLRVLNRLTWVKTNPLPSYQKVKYRNSTEIAMYGNKGERVGFFRETTQQELLGYWMLPIVGGDVRTDHPTQKPLRLISEWVRNSCPDGGIVLDPFMGSGTTLVAAKQLGLRATGIEISREYCDIAVERLRQGVFQF